MTARLAVLLRALTGQDVAPGGRRALEDQVVHALRDAGHEEIWLTLAVLTAALPEPADVVRSRRLAELDGPRAMIHAALAGTPRDRRLLEVEVVSDEVLLDVNHLAQTTLLTGIQRVTHETVRRWHRDHDVTFLRWDDTFVALQRTDVRETAQVLHGPRSAPPPENAPPGSRPPGEAARAAAAPTVVVPWRARFVLPEVALEVSRTTRLRALAQYSRCTTAAIGFDTVPLTSGETTDTNVPAYFMHELSAIRHMDRVAAISRAAATEYDGWRTMISSIGVTGPEIDAILLPSEGVEPTAEALARTRDRYLVHRLPLVLCVGSHEPRKNHLAVLHAAELLWRRGLEFTLVFVGGNAWHSERFGRRLAELQAAGRPVESALGIADETLWALYRLARCTVFPSLNEGFGLPVAESLASGTPVVTSGFGSMQEIASDGGALLVDPRDDHAVAEALATLLTDDTVHARLSDEARRRPVRTWDDYASESWSYLVADAQNRD